MIAKGYIRLLEATRIRNRMTAAGSVVEVSRDTARRLFLQGLAVPHPGPGKRLHETHSAAVPMEIRRR